MGSTNTLEGDVLSLFFCLGKESTNGSCWKIGILDEGSWKKFSKVSSYFMLFLGCLLDFIPPNRFFGKVWYVIFVWGWCKSQLMVDFWFGLVGGLDSWDSSMKGIGILRGSLIRIPLPRTTHKWAWTTHKNNQLVLIPLSYWLYILGVFRGPQQSRPKTAQKQVCNIITFIVVNTYNLLQSYNPQDKKKRLLFSSHM